MANTIARSGGAGGGSFEFIKILLRGTGQVMFQNSAWTGLLFMIGIFWGAYAEGQGLVGWGALLGVTVSQYELAKFGREGLTAANAGLTPLVVAGLCYLIITVPLGQLSAYFERRTQLAGRK